METPEPARDNDDDEMSEDEFPFDLSNDETSDGLDDEEARDLDIGVEIQNTDEREGESEGEMEWDLSEFLAPPPKDAADTDDLTGPDGFDSAIGVEDLAPENLDDASLGFETGETFIAPTMPDWGPEGPDQSLFDERELELPDETQLATTAEPWRLCFEHPGRFEALHVVPNRMFAGGATLLIVEPNHVRSCPTPSGVLLLQSVPMGPPNVGPTLFASTKSGGLLRFSAPAYEDPHWVTDPQGARRGLPLLGLASWPDSSSVGQAMELVVLTVSGQFIAPLRGATILANNDVPAHLTKLPLATDRPLGLVENQAGTFIVEPSATGAWSSRPLPARISQSLGLGPFEFAASGRFIVFAGTRSGVVVADLAAGTFQRLPGCVGVTAVTAAHDTQAPSFWVSLGHEISGRSEFVRIDPERLTATRVAEYATVFDEEFAPVRALAWFPEMRALYATGDFGLLGFAPPDA